MSRTKTIDLRDCAPASKGRLLALDLGTARIGVAVSDELGLTARALPFLRRGSWKETLREIACLVREFDACGVVVGLPLRMDGTEGDAALDARRVARNLELSLDFPVYLQDERLTSRAAEENLRAAGVPQEKIKSLVDGESARLILLDFLLHNTDQNQPG